MVQVSFLRHFVRGTAATAVLLVTSSVCVGENEAARSLVRLVASEDAKQLNEAKKLFDSIPEESPVKPVAVQAMAFIELRRCNFSNILKKSAGLLGGQ